MIVQGNILEATEDIIAHQVNCMGVAGGLAGEIFRKYPEAGDKYNSKVTASETIGSMLGDAQLVDCGDKQICNLFGQFYPGADTRYEALNKSLLRLGKYARENNLTVALPYKLGCGIGGGDWDKVQNFIKWSLTGVQYKIYQLR